MYHNLSRYNTTGKAFIMANYMFSIESLDPITRERHERSQIYLSSTVVYNCFYSLRMDS